MAVHQLVKLRAAKVRIDADVPAVAPGLRASAATAKIRRHRARRKAGADGLPSVDASRVTAAERSCRYRARRRAGKVVATVEVDEEMLAMLAAGTLSNVEVLRGERARINAAVRRALRHLAKCYSKTGRIPTR